MKIINTIILYKTLKVNVPRYRKEAQNILQLYIIQHHFVLYKCKDYLKKNIYFRLLQLTSGIANLISRFPIELTQEMVQPALVLQQQS